MDGARLTRALEKQLAGTAAVATYSTGPGFEEWWSEDGQGVPRILGRLGGLNRLVAVWYEEPGSRASGESVGTDLRQDLNPLDWALAMALNCASRNQPVPELRVHIVDLTGHARVEAWASLWRQQLLSDMPWITLHAPLVAGGRGAGRYRRGYSPITPGGASDLPESLLELRDGSLVLADIGQPMTHASLTASRHALGRLAQQWTASLVQGADHHNVNNLVGPAIISNVLQLPEPATSDPLVNAFVTKLSWTGQMPMAPQNWATQDSGVGAEDVNGSGFERIRVLAVDDELARGWDAILCRFFSKAPLKADLVDNEFRRIDHNEGPDADRIHIFGCTSALPLIKSLSGGAGGASGRDALDRRFRSRDLAFGFTGADPELLILDLRLAARNDTDEARQQIRELLGLVLEADLDKPGGLAWPSIPHNDVHLLQQWLSVGGDPDAPTEAAAITLLARVLALAAPLTPILLFSSTGRADVKEKLKPYRNVLTAFGKPRVLQDFAEVTDAMAAFASSVKLGLAMLVRKDCIARCAAVEAQVQLERQKQGLLVERAGGQPHIDFFFDESQSQTNYNFTLGTAAAVFMDESEAERLQNYLTGQAMEGVGRLPVWAKAKANLQGVPLLKYSSRRSQTEFASDVKFVHDHLKTSGANREESLWTAMRIKRTPREPKALSSQTRSSDLHLDLMLNFSVQFNFMVLPRYLGVKSGTCSLYFDRRSIPPLPGYVDYGNPSQWNTKIAKKHQDAANALKRSFGYEQAQPYLSEAEARSNPNVPGRVLLTTYPESAFYPLVREALVGWSEFSHVLKYRSVRGQKLSDRDLSAAECRSRRLLHDVADWVAGAPAEDPTLTSLFPIRLEGALDDNTQAFMDAARSASWGRDVECIRALLSSKRVSARISNFDPVERILIWACADILRSASGEALHVKLDAVSSMALASLEARPDAIAPIKEAPQGSKPFEKLDTVTSAALASAAADRCGFEPVPAAPDGGKRFKVKRVVCFKNERFWVLHDESLTETGVAVAGGSAAACIGRRGVWTSTGRECRPAKEEPQFPLFELKSWD